VLGAGSAARTRWGFKRCFASAGTVPLKRAIFLSYREEINIFLTMNTISLPVETDRLKVMLRGFGWFMKGCLTILQETILKGARLI
jgi:hypothetical protein